MARPKTDAQDRALAATMDYAWQHGVGEASLRDIATAIGISHRMLLYHFGTKEGLLVEVVRAIEQRQRGILEEGLRADETLTPVEAIRQIWQYATNPAISPYLRLFFEIYGQALQGRPYTASFLDGVVESMADPLATMFGRVGVPAPAARTDARLTLAIFRGLLLDFLATGDKATTTEALERYLELYSTPGERDGSR